MTYGTRSTNDKNITSNRHYNILIGFENEICIWKRQPFMCLKDYYYSNVSNKSTVCNNRTGWQTFQKEWAYRSEKFSNKRTGTGGREGTPGGHCKNVY